jgi:hypothetical protein
LIVKNSLKRQAKMQAHTPPLLRQMRLRNDTLIGNVVFFHKQMLVRTRLTNLENSFKLMNFFLKNPLTKKGRISVGAAS